MIILKISSKLKNSILWYYFLKFLILPIYDFFWTYFINFKGKFLYGKFKKKKISVSHKVPKNLPSIIIRNDKDFQEIAKKISESINYDFIEKKINKIKQDNSISKNRNFTFEFFSDLDEDIKEEIINFVKSDKNLAIANDYLKVFPVVGKIHVYVNFPISNEKERAAMLWHKDDFGYKSLDFFVPITELTTLNGSMFYLNKPDDLHIFNRVPEIINNAQPKERNKVKLDDFRKYFKDQEINEFTGNAGDALLIDSFRVYHRGGYCEKNIRIMFRISYQTPDASRLLDTKQEYYNFYNKSSKYSLKNEMENYLFFGSSIYKNFKFLIKSLLVFYRLAHVKVKRINK
tara:strand:+ start:939 stop:1973 length:1035 start_codon:yes stop_codon:yes gene_type:complete